MLEVVLESMGHSIMVCWFRYDYIKAQLLFIIVPGALSREITSSDLGRRVSFLGYCS